MPLRLSSHPGSPNSPSCFALEWCSCWPELSPWGESGDRTPAGRSHGSADTLPLRHSAISYKYIYVNKSRNDKDNLHYTKFAANCRFPICGLAYKRPKVHPQFTYDWREYCPKYQQRLHTLSSVGMYWCKVSNTLSYIFIDYIYIIIYI